MLSKPRSEALQDAARDILDLMFFVAAEGAPASSPSGSDAMILAQVEFEGLWSGRCTVELPETLARTMAGNFTGIGDGEVRADVMRETIREFANMICGSTITRMGCPGIVTLSPPHLIEEWPRPMPEVQASERWLDSGEGIVHIRFEAEAAT